jgi:hypothetical protein
MGAKIPASLFSCMSAGLVVPDRRPRLRRQDLLVVGGRNRPSLGSRRRDFHFATFVRGSANDNSAISESTILSRVAVVGGLVLRARCSAIWGAWNRGQEPGHYGSWRFGLHRNRILLVVNSMFELPQVAQVVRTVLATCFEITCLTTLPELRREHRSRHGDPAVTSGAAVSVSFSRFAREP